MATTTRCNNLPLDRALGMTKTGWCQRPAMHQIKHLVFSYGLDPVYFCEEHTNTAVQYERRRGIRRHVEILPLSDMPAPPPQEVKRKEKKPGEACIIL